MKNTCSVAAMTAIVRPIVPPKRNRLRRIPRALIAAVLLALMLVPPVAAEEAAAPDAPGGPWQTEATSSFEIRYVKRDPVAAQVEMYKRIADGVFDMETNIFGAKLPVPITLYLYNDLAPFMTVVPAAKDDPNVYSGIDGTGTYVNVYVAVPRMNTLKAAELTSNLRMLVTQQIAASMSGGNLPPGFLHGLARYGEAPPPDLPAMAATLGQQVSDGRIADWATLATSTDAAAAPQQYSVIAFMIDTYGFRMFRNFLTALSTRKDWHAALQSVYTNEGSSAAATMEAKWRAYLPQFLGGLWQRNQFTYYDTDEATQLVGSGQYSQAVALLTPAIAFLQQTGNPKRATDAQTLLSKARAGSEAESRVHDAQLALEANDYARTNQLLTQANDLYKAIPDAKPPLILIQYQQRATRGIQATGDLTAAESAVNGWNVIDARQRANRALGTFTEFGNAPMADRAQAVIERANARIKMAGLGVIGLGLAILVVGSAIISLRRGRQGMPALPPLE